MQDYTTLILNVKAPDGAVDERWKETEEAFVEIEDRLKEFLRREFANSIFTYELLENL